MKRAQTKVDEWLGSIAVSSILELKAFLRLRSLGGAKNQLKERWRRRRRGRLEELFVPLTAQTSLFLLLTPLFLPRKWMAPVNRDEEK